LHDRDWDDTFVDNVRTNQDAVHHTDEPTVWHCGQYGTGTMLEGAAASSTVTDDCGVVASEQ